MWIKGMVASVCLDANSVFMGVGCACTPQDRLRPARPSGALQHRLARHHRGPQLPLQPQQRAVVPTPPKKKLRICWSPADPVTPSPTRWNWISPMDRGARHRHADWLFGFSAGICIDIPPAVRQVHRQMLAGVLVLDAPR